LISRCYSCLLYLYRTIPSLYTFFPYTTLFRSPEFNPRPKLGGFTGKSQGARKSRVLRLPRVLRGGVLKDNMVISTGSGLYIALRSEEHTSELQSRAKLVCRLLLEKKNII